MHKSYFRVLAPGFQLVADKRRYDADGDEKYRSIRGVYLKLGVQIGKQNSLQAAENQEAVTGKAKGFRIVRPQSGFAGPVKLHQSHDKQAAR